MKKYIIPEMTTIEVKLESMVAASVFPGEGGEQLDPGAGEDEE